jgi:hypothetical protein
LLGRKASVRIESLGDLRPRHLDAARQKLETERAEFPESAVFIDRLMANLKKF